jgi:hypothetical protein
MKRLCIPCVKKNEPVFFFSSALKSIKGLQVGMHSESVNIHSSKCSAAFPRKSCMYLLCLNWRQISSHVRKMRLIFRASFPLGSHSRQEERKEEEEERVRCDSVAAGSGVLCNQIPDKPCADSTTTLPHLCADLTDDELTTTVSGKCGGRERECNR